MTTTLPPDTVALGRRSLHHLRAALERSLGVQAASLLQEAGFASGEAMFAAFEAWVGERYGVERAEALDGAYLGEALSSFFARQGWGALTLERPTESVVVLEAREWAESAPRGRALPLVSPVGRPHGRPLLEDGRLPVRRDGGRLPQPR